MSELGLHYVKRYAVAKGFDGIGMSQPVRMGALRESRGAAKPLEQSPDIARVERASPECAEKRSPTVDSESVSHRLPAAKDCECLGIETRHPRPSPFPSANAKDAGTRIGIGGMQGQRFTDSEAAAPEHRDEGLVPRAGCTLVARGEELSDFCWGEDFGGEAPRGTRVGIRHAE